MKSKQVYFFLMPEDISVFEDYLKEKDDVVFLAEPMHKSELRIMNSLIVQSDEEEWVTILLARRDYLDRIYLDYTDAQNYWTINNWKSEVIKFSKSGLDGNILRIGRLYTKTGYYNDAGEWEARDPEFLKWADKIYRWLKKTFKKDLLPGWPDTYMSPAVVEWVQKGGQLSQL